ncbi:hypothetical protein AVEN_169099-1 [Araneus ventricosus]|uniref:Uncharacterized protein n=1 Tax=Araneus ventricosus TaxID=182803 RepID=A0A4Y2G0A7_ARAVE|nr:hypothetical protein AVEN_60392-1 [Araneus ventricosus]GBO36251.1 hypothetical protein AVEN_169099-1 [Araneus ventricosus]
MRKGIECTKRIAECEFEEFETVSVESAVNEIVSLAKIMGLELDNHDIDELVEEHSQELTTEESCLHPAPPVTDVFFICVLESMGFP